MKITRKFSFLFIFCPFIIIIALLTLLPQLKGLNNGSEGLENEFRYDIGFIITRYVNTSDSNKVWIQCIKQIRKYYPDYPIVVLDDASNYDLIDVEDESILNNVLIINVESEHNKSAELLPYYYNYRNKWFKKMIYIQDSIFINSYYDFTKVEKVRFIATGDKSLGQYSTYDDQINELISVLDNKDGLYNYVKKNTWQLCWGIMSVMDYDFLKYINEKYNLEKLLYKVKDRRSRIISEKLFGVICCYEVPELEKEPSIFGIARFTIQSAKYNYKAFISGVLPDQIDNPILKISLKR
jgi:hypothetical protein